MIKKKKLISTLVNIL